MKPLSYALIGTGMMGQEHIKNVHLLDNVAITVFYEPNPTKRAQARALLPHAHSANNLRDMLQHTVDAIIIASPNHVHIDQLSTIVHTDRHVPILLEKPPCTTGNDLPALRQLQTTYAAPIWVAMEYRYMPPIAALIECADAATGGVRMLTMREYRYPFLKKVDQWNRFNRYTGGTFVEKCCHFFDLMRLVLHSEPVRVMASSGQAVNHLHETYPQEQGTIPDVADHGYVIVDFANGTRAMLELCMFAESTPYQEAITALGANGQAMCQVPGPTRFWPTAQGAPPVPRLSIGGRVQGDWRVHEIPVPHDLLAVGDHNGATFYQHQKFAHTVRTGAQPAVSIDDGARAVAMGLVAERSAREGRAVAFAEIWQEANDKIVLK